MFRLVEHLCPTLSPAGLSVLYKHLMALSPQYEEMHIELIRKFAEAASGWGARGGSSSSGGGKAASLEASGGESQSQP